MIEVKQEGYGFAAYQDGVRLIGMVSFVDLLDWLYAMDMIPWVYGW